MKIKIVTTINNIDDLKKTNADEYYFGQSSTSLRLSASFLNSELENLVTEVHDRGKKAIVAVNALISVAQMDGILSNLNFLKKIGVDKITVADPGIVYLLQKEQIDLPFIFDSAIFLTNAGQVNFWAKNGASGALLARELPYAELEAMSGKFSIPVTVQVYGSTCIQHSKRNLLSNYFNFTNQPDQEVDQKKNWYLIDPQDANSHYSIFEDNHGTHVFASNDLNLIMKLNQLTSLGYTSWFIDGLYTPNRSSSDVVNIFDQARKLIEAGEYNLASATLLDEELRKLSPSRHQDQGFFAKNPAEIS